MAILLPWVGYWKHCRLARYVWGNTYWLTPSRCPVSSVKKACSRWEAEFWSPPLFRACSKYSNLFLVLVNFIARARALSVSGDQLLLQTLVKIRVETQAMCLAQLVLSCMNTLLDLSSSVSTSVLWKRTRNVILRRWVQGYHMAYLDQWWNRERKINCWLSLVVENSPQKTHALIGLNPCFFFFNR